MKTRILLAGLTLAMSFGPTSCKREQPSTTEPLTPPADAARRALTVRIGYLPIAAGLPLFVAVEKGFFTDAGFNVELTRFSSSNELGTAATLSRIDALMPFALNAAFDIGTVTGKHHRLFGCNIYSDKKPHIVDCLVVRKGSGIESISDLQNRRIAGFPGSVTRIFVENIFRKHGLQPNDYTYIELGPGDWLPALQSGSIDAASVMEPQASAILSNGVADVLVEGFFAKLMPDVPLSGHWLAADFVDATDPSTQTKFVDAYNKAVAFIRESPEEAKQYYSKYIGVNVDAIRQMQLNIWTQPDEIDRDRLQLFADLLSSNGAIQGRVEVAKYLWRQ